MIQIKEVNIGKEKGTYSEGPEEAQSAAWVINLGEANGEGLISGLCSWVNRVENVEELSLGRKMMSLILGYFKGEVPVGFLWKILYRPLDHGRSALLIMMVAVSGLIVNAA